MAGLIGDIPPPSAADTVQSTTPEGVKAARETSCQYWCSATTVPGAAVDPPRVKKVALPATPAAATSANAWAMLFAALEPTLA